MDFHSHQWYVSGTVPIDACDEPRFTNCSFCNQVFKIKQDVIYSLMIDKLQFESLYTGMENSSEVLLTLEHVSMTIHCLQPQMHLLQGQRAKVLEVLV